MTAGLRHKSNVTRRNSSHSYSLEIWNSKFYLTFGNVDRRITKLRGCQKFGSGNFHLLLVFFPVWQDLRVAQIHGRAWELPADLPAFLRHLCPLDSGHVLRPGRAPRGNGLPKDEEEKHLVLYIEKNPEINIKIRYGRLSKQPHLDSKLHFSSLQPDRILHNLHILFCTVIAVQCHIGWDRHSSKLWLLLSCGINPTFLVNELCSSTQEKVIIYLFLLVEVGWVIHREKLD